MDLMVKITSKLIEKYHVRKIKKIIKSKENYWIKQQKVAYHVQWLEANSEAHEITQFLHDVYVVFKGLKK